MTGVARALSLFGIAMFVAGAPIALGQINPQGKPMNTGVGRAEHYEVWHDQGGWHLRTFTKEYDHHFKGVISVSGGEIEGLRGYRLEHRGPQKDFFILGPERHVVNFDFSTKGSVDGVDFRVKGKAPMLSFTLMLGEREPKFEPDRIFIGGSSAHPQSNPFELPAHGGRGM